jgi:hypothetical protein
LTLNTWIPNKSILENSRNKKEPVTVQAQEVQQNMLENVPILQSKPMK